MPALYAALRTAVGSTSVSATFRAPLCAAVNDGAPNPAPISRTDLPATDSGCLAIHRERIKPLSHAMLGMRRFSPPSGSRTCLMRRVSGFASVPTPRMACEGSSTSPRAGKDAPGGQCLEHASIASAAADATSGTSCVTSLVSRSWPHAAPSAGTYSSSSAMSAATSSSVRVSSAAPSSPARLLVLSRSTTTAH